MEIRLTKLKELPDALHPNNIEEGFVKEGKFIAEPRVGECFYIGDSWRTSYVSEIIDQNTFKTCNSIYKWASILPTSDSMKQTGEEKRTDEKLSEDYASNDFVNKSSFEYHNQYTSYLAGLQKGRELEAEKRKKFAEWLSVWKKDQMELLEFTKKHGHPVTENYEEGGLDMIAKIISNYEKQMKL